MLYLEYTPAAPLAGLVRSLWYAQAQVSAHSRERILPTGRVQVILNLNRDYLLDCPKDAPAQRMAPALVVGARSMYEIVDCTDMADLIGVVFEPGGFALFACDAVDLFSNRSTPLDDVWNAAARGLRERLLELATPAARLRCMEGFLRERLASAVTLRMMQRPRRFRLRCGCYAGALPALCARLRARPAGASAGFRRCFARRLGLRRRPG